MSELSSDNGRRMELQLPCVHRFVRLARNLVRRFARMDGVDGGEIDTLVLVTSELLENAVDHGGGNAAREVAEATKSMRLELELGDSAWWMRVSDQGGGDAGALGEAARSGELPDLEDERGRGFFLLSNLVDSLDVEPSQDGLGVAIVVSKTLPA